ncbi:MAG: AAA family ATPase [Candidatus Magnetominusculus sp. LBB02]|nr:AAA family ATPase [Candidatus Magnetominusculus sp. LBB02]
MDYYRLLNLNKEPFSNSPELELFYPCSVHVDCLHKLEMAIRFKRGLNVVMGDVGTGKTTLCRQLIMHFSNAEDKVKIETHLIMDPSFDNAIEFLQTISKIFGLPETEAKGGELHYKEDIKNYLYAKGVQDDKTVVLIIDEGQKIPTFCLEILREFLNYETDQNKLLQIVIFAQNEFNDTLYSQNNLLNRVNLCCRLRPLSFFETYNMIKFRVERSSDMPRPLFTIPAIFAVYRYSRGYPRSINMLCHHVMLGLIIKSKQRAGWNLVRFCAAMNLPSPSSPHRLRKALLPVTLFVILSLALVNYDLLNLKKYLGNAELAGEFIHSVDSKAVNFKNSVKKESRPEAAPQPVNVASKEPATAVEDIKKPEPLVQKTPSPSYKMPETLGSLTVEDGETLFNVLLVVYGETSHSYSDNPLADAVLKINPEITNIDVLEVGSAIKLPAIKQADYKTFRNSVMIQLTTTDSADNAYKLYRQYKQHGVSIIPTWSKDKGLVFSVMLRKTYTNSKAAKTALHSLPEEIAKGAKIVDKWNEETVFFHKIEEGA